MLYLASDHAGFELKEALKTALEKDDVKFTDLGPKTFVQEDDFVDFVIPLTEKVLAAPEENLGILICGNGVGVCIAANKITGIRAGIGYNLFAAETMRKDDDANVLCLAGRVLQPEFAAAIMRKFINTKFSAAERHVRRLAKVAALEKK